MTSNSNNSIILIVLIVFIIVILYLNLNNNNDNGCNLCNENFKNNESPRKRRVYFKQRDNVKYFDKKESPSYISEIEEYQEKNEVEEFDYDIENFTENKDTQNVSFYLDSNKSFKFEKINKEDSILVKSNKLSGTPDFNINDNQLQLIQGTETEVQPLNIKSKFIYDNSEKPDKVENTYKFKGFSGNGLRSL